MGASINEKGCDFCVINVHETVNGLVIGIAMIVAGLYPSLLRGLAEHLIEFTDQLRFRFASPYRSTVQFHQQRWLAALGAAMITASLLAYFVK